MISIWHIAPGSWLHGAGNYLCQYVREESIDMPDKALCRFEMCASKGHCYRYQEEACCDACYGRFTTEYGQDRCAYYIPAKMEVPE